jgi:hypothetical protein
MNPSTEEIGQDLDYSLDVVSAEIYDFLDSTVVGLTWGYSIDITRIGVTDFIFTHETFGDVGKIRLTAKPNSKSRFVSRKPRKPSESEIMELIAAGKLIVDLDGPVAPLLQIYLRRKELGIKEPEDYFNLAFSEEPPVQVNPDLGPDASEKIRAAEAELEELGKKVYRKRLENHASIVNAIVSDLQQVKLWHTSDKVKRVNALLHESGTLETIRRGNLKQFQGFIDAVQSLRHLRYDLPLHGPISSGLSLKWLVVNGFNIVLDALENNREMSTGIGERMIKITPEMKLNDFAEEAERAKIDILDLLKAGRMMVTELPGGRIRILFTAGQLGSLFWKWAKELIDEMDRQGFLEIDPHGANQLTETRSKSGIEVGARSMGQYSLSLEGTEWKDNEELVNWQCGKCRALFDSKAEAVNHIQAEHSRGTAYPRINTIGIGILSGVLPNIVGEDSMDDLLADEPMLLDAMGFRAENVGMAEGNRTIGKLRRGGRPHCEDDVWAWEQVNEHGRSPTEVRKEWEDREGVVKRRLVDPDRQFKRIIKPDWL